MDVVRLNSFPWRAIGFEKNKYYTSCDCRVVDGCDWAITQANTAAAGLSQLCRSTKLAGYGECLECAVEYPICSGWNLGLIPLIFSWKGAVYRQTRALALDWRLNWSDSNSSWLRLLPSGSRQLTAGLGPIANDDRFHVLRSCSVLRENQHTSWLVVVACNAGHRILQCFVMAGKRTSRNRRLAFLSGGAGIHHLSDLGNASSPIALQ